jgi:hypothetical protein
MKQLLALITALIFYSFIGWAEETFEYKMTNDKKESTISTTIEETGNGYRVSSGQEGEKREITGNYSFETHSFHFVNKLQGSDYTATRNGNKIKVSGRLKNRTLNREFSINGNPWLQALDYALEQFAGTGKNKITFWFFNANECEIHEMEATKQGVKTITVNSKSSAAQHIKVNLTGFASIFWSADYWFRPEDNRFIRYETVEGAGGPKITIELVNEKK